MFPILMMMLLLVVMIIYLHSTKAIDQVERVMTHDSSKTKVGPKKKRMDVIFGPVGY